MNTRTNLLLLFNLLLILFTGPGCAVNPVTGNQDIVMMSEQDEIALGRKSNQQVLQEYAAYDDPKLQAYVQSVGQQLAAKSHRTDLVYRFTVLDSKEVNAFALPGGYIYITRGLMGYLNSEAELAAVLGHEIGHVTARHAVRQYSAAQLANIGATLGAIFIPGMNTTASDQLVQFFGTALLRGYGREHELEADQLGAEYLARAGYDPQAMLEVIRVLKNQETFEVRAAKAEGREANIYHGLFSTHPDNDTRLQEVIGSAEKYRNASLTYTGKENYLKQINGLVFGDSPREGILRGRNFYHTDLGFALQLPKNWNIANQPQQLIITAPNGAAIMQMAVEDINKRITPKEFMLSRLGLKKLGHDTVLNINGLSAHTGLAPINTGLGDRTARFTVIYYGDRAYVLAGITKDPARAADFDPYFLDTAQSFHAITDKERALASPLRIETVVADTNTRFSTLASQSPLEAFPEEQLRLINAMYPQGEPAPGTTVKIIK